MTCSSCAAGRQAEFAAEINLHFSGLNNIDKPGVLLFPKVMVCMDCGCSQFSTPKSELTALAGGVSTNARGGKAPTGAIPVARLGLS